MRVAVVVLTWNAAMAAVVCLESVMRQHKKPNHILVVDNASEDNTIERIRQHYPQLSILRNKRNLGFGGGINVGIRALQALPEPPDLVALLNQDTLLDAGWLEAIIAPFQADPQVGAVGSKILYDDGTIQHAGLYLEWPRAVAQHVGWHEPDRGQYDERQVVAMVTGAAIALRMEALKTVGLFDDGYAPAYYEDADLCWRLQRHGYRIIYAPQETLTHYESLSLRDEFIRSSYYNRGRLRFVLKTYQWTDILGSFAESECSFILEHGHTVEARALRWAYIQTLIHLDEILQARSAFYPALEDEQKHALIQMLYNFKRTLTESLYRRACKTINAMHVS